MFPIESIVSQMQYRVVHLQCFVLYDQVLYAAELRQLKMMKLLSTRARQTVKYFCRNSHAWKKPSGKFIHKTVKFLTDNENEIHGHSRDAEVMPEVEDDCKVRLLVNKRWYSAELVPIWGVVQRTCQICF